jgi:hypothetical protein
VIFDVTVSIDEQEMEFVLEGRPEDVWGAGANIREGTELIARAVGSSMHNVLIEQREPVVR